MIAQHRGLVGLRRLLQVGLPLGRHAGLQTCLLAAALCLVACGVNPTVPSPARYALVPRVAEAPAAPPAAGLDRAVAAPAALNVWLAGVTAPAWLDDPGISYQLSFRDPNRRALYRDSRWIAPPASLFAERLRERLAASHATGTRTLHIELQEWTQIFSDPTHSDVLVRFRASLLPLSPEGTAQSKEFSVRLAAPAANAQGAVAGLSAASDEALDALGVWLTSTL